MSSELFDDYVLTQNSPLTDDEVKILSVLTLISSCMSILGSAVIIRKVVVSRSNSTPYNRIMLGLSCSDIVASISYALGPFLVPAKSSQRVWAVGNETSCSILGWLTQVGLSAVWYNALLSFYYLLTVRFGISRHEFARRYEKFFHGLTWIFFICTASVGYAMDYYDEFDVGQGCWIGEIPKGCTADGTCTGRGRIIGWTFGGIWVGMTYLALVINNVTIYSYVRKALQLKVQPMMAVTTTVTEATAEGCGGVEGGSGRDFLQASFVTTGSNGGINNNLPGFSSTEERFDPELEERALRNEAHVEEVASQGLLYVGFFMISFSPAFALGIMDSFGYGPSDEGSVYPLLLAGATLVPLQGFFNMIIHTRPSYNRFRATYPEYSWFWALRRAFVDHDIPRYSDAVLSVVRSRSSFIRAPSRTNSYKPHQPSFVQDDDDNILEMYSDPMERNGTSSDDDEGGLDEEHLFVEVILQQDQPESKQVTTSIRTEPNETDEDIVTLRTTDGVRNKSNISSAGLSGEDIEERPVLVRKKSSKKGGLFPKRDDDQEDGDERPGLTRSGSSMARRTNSKGCETASRLPTQNENKRDNFRELKDEIGQVRSPVRKASRVEANINPEKDGMGEIRSLSRHESKREKVMEGEVLSPIQKGSRHKKSADQDRDDMGQISPPKRQESTRKKVKDSTKDELSDIRSPNRKESRREKNRNLEQDGLGELPSLLRQESKKLKEPMRDDLVEMRAPTRKESKYKKTTDPDRDDFEETSSLKRQESIRKKIKDSTKDELGEIRSPTRKESRRVKNGDVEQDGLGELPTLSRQESKRGKLRKESKREKNSNPEQDSSEEIQSPKQQEGTRKKVKESMKDEAGELRSPTRKASKRDKNTGAFQDGLGEIRTPKREGSIRGKLKGTPKDQFGEVRSPARKESRRETNANPEQGGFAELPILPSKHEKFMEPIKDDASGMVSPIKKGSRHKKSTGSDHDDLEQIASPKQQESTRKKVKDSPKGKLGEMRSPTRKESRREKNTNLEQDGLGELLSLSCRESKKLKEPMKDDLGEIRSPTRKESKREKSRDAITEELSEIRPPTRKESRREKSKDPELDNSGTDRSTKQKESKREKAKETMTDE